jgi:phage tail-like protein
MIAAPPASFQFVIRFEGLPAGDDTSFLEVSGIGSEMDTIASEEGGENHFVHSMPVGVKHMSLTLKRGIAPNTSTLVQWCKATFESGFAEPIETRDVTVYLLDHQGAPLRGWSFSNAFPTSWSVDPFQAEKGSIAIEKIALSYTAMTRKL